VLACVSVSSSTNLFFLTSTASTSHRYELGDCIRLVIKYPLMFYFIKRFRHHFRRIFLGDKFWGATKSLKSKLVGELNIKKGYDVHFASEHAARKQTCRAILADLYGQPLGAGALNTDEHEPVTFINDTVCNHLKKSIGYKLAKSLILESELDYVTEGQLFLNSAPKAVVGSKDDTDSRFHDKLSGEDLKYNNLTGKRAWICRYTDYNNEAGPPLKEIDIDVCPEFPDDWNEEESEGEGDY
jgi:hypothetical protein